MKQIDIVGIAFDFAVDRFLRVREHVIWERDVHVASPSAENETNLFV